MSQLQAYELPLTGESTSAESERRIVPPLGGLVSWLDSEWLLFEAFLLIPALLCLLAGDAERAQFYGRLALHAGCLKWLGWGVLTRGSGLRPLRFLTFPVELVVGLTIAVLWFYVRNFAGWLVPGSYSLRELGVLPWLVASGHLLGAIVNRRSISDYFGKPSETLRSLWPRAYVYSAFTLTLTVTLWSVAKEIFPPSQDGWFHGFIARVYLNDGLFYPHFNGGHAIFYTSGFGGINAVTAAVSGLSVVKVHNLQHILWAVVGLYALTALVALVARRLLAAVHVLPLLFLNVYPVHNLPPHVHWEHGPQQLAPALLVSVPILSLLFPARRQAFYTGIAIQAALSAVILALSPACAPFLLIACAAALLINCYRGRTILGERIPRVAAMQAGFTLLAALFLLGSDRYYSVLILSPGRASYMTGSHYGGNAAAGANRLFTFSPRQGLASVAAVNPLGLMQWPAEAAHLPGRHLGWLVLTLVVSAGLLARRHRTAAPSSRYLAVGAAASLIVWLAAKYGVTFFADGMTNRSDDASLLYEYLFFLGRRVELWLLFLAGLTAAVSVGLADRDGRESAVARATITVVVITLAAWWLPHMHTHLDPRRNHLIARNLAVSGTITRDDIELAAWMEHNLPPDKGLVGLTSIPFKARRTKLLFPVGASQTLPLYGKGYNFCFQVYDPGRPYSYDDYTQHVANFLDVDWCLKNSIRYFHVPKADVPANHGLSRAREIGLLQLVREVPSSGVYEVRPLPWKPRRLSIPTTPESSHQVRWQADGSGIVEGADPQLVFTLKQAEFVHAIHFKYTRMNVADIPAFAQLFWKRADQLFVEHERTAHLRIEPNREEETLTILVHDTLDQFRFDPDVRPGSFKIHQIELLIKPPGQ